MGMGQGIKTGLGHRASPVSYRHNFSSLFIVLIELFNSSNV